MEYIALIWVFSAIVAGAIANNKGRSGFGWFLLGLMFSVLAVIFVALLPSKKAPAMIVAGEAVTPETHIRCPTCKGFVHKEAAVCMHCKQALVPASRQPHAVTAETPVEKLATWLNDLRR